MSPVNPSSHNTPYVGRFAPSPTGPLHFGSLVSALASYLDAHHHQGKWLVRMEDVDPPREQVGAADAILRCFEDYGLNWDGSVAYQSQRSDIYHAELTADERLEARAEREDERMAPAPTVDAPPDAPADEAASASLRDTSYEPAETHEPETPVKPSQR